MLKYLPYILFVVLLNRSVSCSIAEKYFPDPPFLGCYIGNIVEDFKKQPELPSKIDSICHTISTKLRALNICHKPIVYYCFNGHIKVLLNQDLFIYRADSDICILLSGKEMTSSDLLKIISRKKYPIDFTVDDNYIPEDDALYAGAAYLKYSILHRLFKLDIVPEKPLKALNFNTQLPDYSQVTFGDSVLSYELSSRRFGTLDEKTNTFHALSFANLCQFMRKSPA